MAPGDFIGFYRVLAEISRRDSSVTYLVEQPALGPTEPAYLTVWPEIHLREPWEERAFTQACEDIKESQAAAFPLLKSGLEQGIPYIILSAYEASEEGIALLDRRLQNRADNAPASGTFVNAAQEPPKPTRALAVRRKFASVRRRTWVSVFAALLIVICCTSGLYVVLPASGAMVTLVPKSVHLQRNLQVVVFTQPDQAGDAHADIQGHLISYTTPTQTQSSPATGVVHHDATKATGQVVVSNISLNYSDSDDIGASTLDSNSGVSITLDQFTARQGATVTVAAEAANAGSRGNIGAYDIDFPVDLCGPYDYLCSSPTGSAYVQNPQPFSGGSDAYDQSTVLQSDIDAAAQPLITQLTPSAQEGLAQLLPQQMQPGDQAVLPKPECAPNVQPDHHVNDPADTVTVQVSVTCYQITYAQQDFIPGVIHAQQWQVDTEYGSKYSLAGDLLADTPVFSKSDTEQQTVTVSVNAKSIWVYQVDADQKAKIAQQIVGISPSDAKKRVLPMYKDIQDVTFALQGFGSKLPTDASAVHVAVQAIPGLHR